MSKLVQATCKECHTTAGDEFCLECEKILCSKCKVAHLKKKSSKKHHVDKAYYKLLDKRPSCVIHSKEVVFYCASCSLLICPSCMLEKHKQHDIEEIDAAISAKKERIQAEVQDLQSRSENVNQLIDDLNSYEDGYKLDNAIVIKLVTAKGESLKELIDKRTEYMIQMVNNEENVQLNRKYEEIEKLDEIKTLYQSQTLRLNSSVEDTKDVDLLMSYVEWEKDIQHLELSKISEFKPMPPIRFMSAVKGDEKVAQLFGKLEIGYRELQEGDRIKIKPTVAEPIHGCGDVTHDSIGIVKDVSNDTVTVDFPEFLGWEGTLSEVEIVLSLDEEQKE